MAQLPDSIRPYATVLAKHHFWLLALLAPLLLLPLLRLANASMGGKIKLQKDKIDSQIKALKTVAGRKDHPNEAWSKAIETQVKAIRQETLGEWKRFWDSQQSLRVWPDKFGPDFVKAVVALRPGANLDRQFLQRYQNMVPDVVRQLPGRMGSAEAMADATAKAGSGKATAGGARGIVVWSADDQTRLYKSFKWDRTPSTVQVLLAQEELWLYGMWCDFVARANQRATGAFDATITDVEQLAIGYPAAEDRPGGEGGGRILAAEAAAAPPPTDAAATGGTPAVAQGPAVRPSHPRFGGGTAPAAPRSGEPGAADGLGATQVVASPDAPFREWIYVDFSGRPLTATELASAPEAQMVHLVPFVLRVVMDERRLDALLADIAASAIPIDVRQVRINADSAAGAASTPAASGGSTQRRRRPYDATIELRGTVALATAPDEKVFDTLQLSTPGVPAVALPPRRPALWTRRFTFATARGTS